MVEALGGQKLAMRAAFDYLALLQDQDLVRITDGAQSVGDYEAGTAVEQFLQLMGGFDKGRIVALLVRRGGNSLYIPLRIDGNG